jgi:glycine hydroxymethyltransferase
LGTPACTTRGFGVKEFEIVSNYVADILDVIPSGITPDNALDNHIIKNIKSEVLELCKKFKIY